jgi:hypothetical protein
MGYKVVLFTRRVVLIHIPNLIPGGEEEEKERKKERKRRSR